MAIYYGAPDKDYPVGGIRVIYRHVDLLNRNGFDAFVLHHYFPFRCTWFENETRVAHEVRYPDFSRSLPARLGRRTRRALGRAVSIEPRPVLELDADDILVVPEVMPGLADIAPAVRKVIFNQNAYLTLAPYSLDVDAQKLACTRPEVLGAIVVLEDSRRYLETLFPDLPVRRVHYGIDPELFAFTREKKRQIAYMPRKNPHDLHQVLLRLRLTGRLEGWDVVAIADRPEAETAAILRESAVFLSSGHPEGSACRRPRRCAQAAWSSGTTAMAARSFSPRVTGFRSPSATSSSSPTPWHGSWKSSSRSRPRSHAASRRRRGSSARPTRRNERSANLVAIWGELTAKR